MRLRPVSRQSLPLAAACINRSVPNQPAPRRHATQVVRAYYTRMDAPSQAAIKGALLTWLQRDCTVESAGALPPFLRNKLAQVLVAIVQLEYPAVWPTFFRDLIAAAHQGPGLADMLCRVMVSVDEDIISLDIPRCAPVRVRVVGWRGRWRCAGGGHTWRLSGGLCVSYT